MPKFSPKQVAKIVFIIALMGSVGILVLLFKDKVGFTKTEKPKFSPVLGLEEIQDKNYVGTYVWTGEIDNKTIFGSWSNTKDPRRKRLEEQRYEEVKPYIKAACMNFTKIYDLLQSPAFKMIKSKVDKIRDNVQDKDNFSYVILPTIVFDSCKNDDQSFKDGMVRFLQSDFNEVMLLEKENIRKYVDFIGNIQFAPIDDSLMPQVKTDKKVFDSVFFQKNLSGIEDVYFWEYTFMKNKSDKEFFTHFSILSLKERNETLERTMGQLTAYLNKWNIKDIREFRALILKSYWYGSLEGVKKSAVEQYTLFDKKLKEKQINLTLELVDITSLEKFYTSDKFQVIKRDPELFALFKQIGLEHLHYSILSDNFADSLNEWWSGKEQFGDSIIWNGIIRIGYMYIRENLKWEL